jgi:hypothetical protein
MEVTICTIGFANPATMTRTFALVKRLKNPKTEWLVLDNHYSEESSLWLKCNAETFGYKLFSQGFNMGLHDGYNYLFSLCKTSHVIGLDPDTLPVTKHFDDELMKHANEKNVWISCFNTHSYSEMRFPIYERDIIIPQHPVVNSICCFSRDWLNAIGGIQEPTKLYGGLECCMWKYLDQKEKRWIFALNCLEACSNSVENLQDDVYRCFKFDHAHKGDPRSWEQYRSEFVLTR